MQHDYISIRFDATFDYPRNPVLKLSGRGDTQTKTFAVKSPDITVTASTSHPPLPEVVQVISTMTTVLLQRTLPQVRERWYPPNQWEPIEWPERRSQQQRNHFSLFLYHVTHMPIASTQSSAMSSSTSKPFTVACKYLLYTVYLITTNVPLAANDCQSIGM